jgi:hypothetical protein
MNSIGELDLVREGCELLEGGITQSIFHLLRGLALQALPGSPRNVGSPLYNRPESLPMLGCHSSSMLEIRPRIYAERQQKITDHSREEVEEAVLLLGANRYTEGLDPLRHQTAGRYRQTYDTRC